RFGRESSRTSGMTMGYGSARSHDGRSQRHMGYGNDDSQRGYGSEGDDAMPNYRGRGPKGYKKSDELLTEQICEMLADSAEIDATDIEVQVKDGEVTLSGFVASRY